MSNATATATQDRANPTQVDDKRKNVSATEFISAYQSSTSDEQVAEKLGITPASVRTRKAQYVKRGIELKTFPRKPSRRNLDVEALNALAKSIAEKQKEEAAASV